MQWRLRTELCSRTTACAQHACLIVDRRDEFLRGPRLALPGWRDEEREDGLARTRATQCFVKEVELASSTNERRARGEPGLRAHKHRDGDRADAVDIALPTTDEFGRRRRGLAAHRPDEDLARRSAVAQAPREIDAASKGHAVTRRCDRVQVD